MVNYVYICSAGHSGSTLLDLLLGTHSNVETVGEISHLSKNIALNTKCTCGMPVRSCDVWGEVLNIVDDQLGVDVYKDPYSLNMGYSKASVVVDEAHQNNLYLLKRKIVLGFYYLKLRFGIKLLAKPLASLDESINHTYAVYNAIRKVQKVDVVVDSSKEYLKAIGIYKKSPDRTRIIVLTRDGRGVFYSNLKRGYTLKRSLNAWKRLYARAMPLLKQHVESEHILHVKYEDLAENAAREAARICEFIGLNYESEMLDFSGKVHHSTNGNDMRFSKSSEIRIDKAWKEKMSIEQLRYFNRHAGKLNRDFGYQ